MWLSIRNTFRAGDDGWPEYVQFIGLPQLTEVRTLDTALNEEVNGGGPVPLSSFSELAVALKDLPAPSPRQYTLLYLEAESESVPGHVEGARLLGYDLCDETETSSLLNCGPWTGKLADFTLRLNSYGLLGLDGALKAKALLPVEWPDEPHANVTVWALYEIAQAHRAEPTP